MKHIHRKKIIPVILLCMTVNIGVIHSDESIQNINNHPDSHHTSHFCQSYKKFYNLFQTINECTEDSPIQQSSISTESTTLPNLPVITDTLIPTTFFPAMEVYPTDVIEAIEPSSIITISTSSSQGPTATSEEPPGVPVFETVLTMTAVEKLQETGILIQPNTPSDPIVLPTADGITEPTTATEHITTIEPTRTVMTINADDYTHITTKPKNIVRPVDIAEATGTTTPTNTREPISATTPPDVVLPTDITVELDTSTPELTSTVVPTIAVLPTTEHTEIIEPTPTTEYTVMINTIVRTTPVVFSTANGITILDDISEPTSVVASDATITPSLPSNISTVIVV